MIWHGEALVARVEQGARRGVQAGIGIIEQHWVDLLTTGSRSGRVYRRRGVAHQASAPGEPPASDTGNLLNSRIIELIPDEIAARMRITAAYAPHLEYGTKNMEPRPSARVAASGSAPDVRNAILFEVRMALQ